MQPDSTWWISIYMVNSISIYAEQLGRNVLMPSVYFPTASPLSPLAACGILVPWALSSETTSSNNWTAREFPTNILFIYLYLDAELARIAVVQLLSHVWLFATLWTEARQAIESSAVSWSLLKFMSVELVMLSNHLILCCHLLLLLSVFPRISVFSKELTLHQVAKLLELHLQHQSFQRTFRVDLLQDWLVCQDYYWKKSLGGPKGNCRWRLVYPS